MVRYAPQPALISPTITAAAITHSPNPYRFFSQTAKRIHMTSGVTTEIPNPATPPIRPYARMISRKLF
jgi:hypothetical protein